MSGSLKTLLGVAVVLILATVSWFFLLYQPSSFKLESLRAETEDLLLKLRSFRVTSEQIATLESQAEKLKEEITTKTDKVVPKDRLPEIVQSIRQHGRRHGLQFEQMIPDYQALIPIEDETAEVTEVMKLTLHLQLQGYYKSLGRFLESLQELPYLISVGEVSVAYSDELHPKLMITVDAILYLRPQELET